MGDRPVTARAGATARGAWRQLTSMRTALVLLFLLALAAVPGSVLPQRDVNREAVNRFFADNPRLAPVLDRLGGFDVYGAPWFAALYLLLFVSLLGCVIPRARDHLRALRRPPVEAPRRLARLPQHAGRLGYDGPPQAAAAALQTALRSRRWRTVVRDHEDGSVTVSAEKGYLKETGNLLMHAAMVVLLVGLAAGSAYGWHANRLVVTGPEHQFCNTPQQYDEYRLGQRVAASSLPGFCFTLTRFEAEFSQTGIPTRFRAHGQVSEDAGRPRPVIFWVNAPLRLDGATVYLLGHGYAPILRYTDRYGQSQTVTAPFLPFDALGTAEGLAAFPDANLAPDGERDRSLQVAFEGLYLPTAPPEGQLSIQSIHPEERAPRLLLVPYRGDLGLDAGIPGSVYRLDPDQVASGALRIVGSPQFLRPGETMTLDDGTTVEFLGTQRYIVISVRHDPGQPVTLAGAGLLLAGLLASLTGRRRRIWLRITPGDGRSRVEAGGLSRTRSAGFPAEFRRLVDALPLTNEATVAEPASTLRST